jgi:hypothetical protein
MKFPWWQRLFSRRVREHLRREAAALPDGTRVRLVCQCSRRDHAGVWTTSWTPRRLDDIDVCDDYMLTRESDGESTYATRGAIEPVQGEAS